jgi:hypothetical protein
MSASLPAPFSPPAVALPAPRAFATTPRDLDLPFEGRDRAALVTALLAQCCAGESWRTVALEEAAWNLPLSARIARLLQIVELTLETDTLTVTQPCAHADCRQPFELVLPLAPLLASSPGDECADKVVQFPVEEHASISLRLPTGRDQSAWRNQRYENETAALTAIVHSLVVDPVERPALSAEQLAPLAAAMEAADPLVAFTVHTTCPICQRSGDIAVDLEAATLRELAGARRAALADVHLLATHYGWTESEVLAIPPRRRAEYRKILSTGERARS